MDINDFHAVFVCDQTFKQRSQLRLSDQMKLSEPEKVKVCDKKYEIKVLSKSMTYFLWPILHVIGKVLDGSTIQSKVHDDMNHGRVPTVPVNKVLKHYFY